MSASTNGTKGKSSTDAVREVFDQGEQLTDAQLVARLPDFHRGQTIPARIRLERTGEVELAGQNEAGHNVWRCTPPERRDEARQAGIDRKKSPVQKLARLSPTARAQVVAALLEDREVNRILREQSERAQAWRRARARASDSHLESEAERRERKRVLREAEREKSRYLDFLKVHDGLRDSIAVLFGIRGFLREEVQRRKRSEESKIPFERWFDVGNNLREVILVGGAVWHDLAISLDQPPESCPLCGERIARDPRALDEGYIDAHAHELSANDLIGDGEDV